MSKMKLVMAIAMMSGFSSFSAIAGTSVVATTTVASNCSAVSNVGAFPFARYPNNSPVPVDATTTVTAICTAGVAYNIAIGAGAGYNLSRYSGLRSLTNGPSHLGYAVYVGNVGNGLWGDGINVALGPMLGTVGTGSPQVFTVAGRILSGQATIPGSYADIFTVMLSY